MIDLAWADLAGCLFRHDLDYQTEMRHFLPLARLAAVLDGGVVCDVRTGAWHAVDYYGTIVYPRPLSETTDGEPIWSERNQRANYDRVRAAGDAKAARAVPS